MSLLVRGYGHVGACLHSIWLTRADEALFLRARSGRLFTADHPAAWRRPGRRMRPEVSVHSVRKKAIAQKRIWAMAPIPKRMNSSKKSARILAFQGR